MRRVILTIGVFCTLTLTGAAQQEPRFDVASVRRATPGETGGRVQFLPGGRFLAQNVSLEFVIQQVYQLRDFQVVAAPPIKALIRDGNGARYYIEGRGREDAAPEQLREMAKTLLAERFQLRVHEEKRDLPVYALILSGDGVKGARTPDGKSGGLEYVAPGWLRGFGTEIRHLADALSRSLDRPVVDQTNLTHILDFDLTWTTNDNPADTPGCHPGVLEMAKRLRYAQTKLNCPSIFTAVREQLGLVLDARRAPMPVIVIDSVEQLTPN